MAASLVNEASMSRAQMEHAAPPPPPPRGGRLYLVVMQAIAHQLNLEMAWHLAAALI